MGLAIRSTLCVLCHTLLWLRRGLARGLARGLRSKDSSCQCRGMQIPPLLREDPLEQDMETHSRILAWEIPRTEEPGELRSIGS